MARMFSKKNERLGRGGRDRHIGLLGLLLFLLLPASDSALGQEESATPPAGTVQTLVEQVQATRRQYQQLMADQQLAEKKIQGQIERLEKEVDQAKATLGRAQEKQRDLTANIAEYRGRKASARLSFNRLHAALETALDTATVRVESGIPFRKPGRVKILAEARRKINSPSLSDQVDGLEAVGRFYEDELRLARDVDVWNAPVRPGTADREVPAFHIRLGLCQQFYVSETGVEMGMATVAEDARWIPVTCSDDRKQLLLALDMLRGRVAPHLTCLPFLTTQDGVDEVDCDQ